MSLRARLVIGLLALAALGLVIAGVVTYAEQRSFLFDRVDQQARAGLPAVSNQLSEQGINVPGYERHRDPLRGGPGGGLGGPGVGLGGPGGPPGGRPGPAPVILPPGTYGQRRDASGRVLGNVVLAFGDDALPAPDLPAELRDGEVVTVDSVDGSDVRYRATAAQSFAQPGTTVIAVPLEEADRTLDRLLRVEVLVIGGVLLALALLSWWLVRVGLRPLDRIGETAGAIAAGDLSRRVDPATPKTEVGRLGMALNGMLERLEQAFAEREASENRLRRFLADASHELRTPLASIRGYAELFRTGAARNEADTEKAMRRIEDESARMGMLVEELLILARLDQTREAVRERVDLSRIALDAVSDAQAIDPERPIDLSAPKPAIVVGDPHQLGQVMANLLRNAAVHTPPRTPVEVSVDADGDGRGAVFTIRDHGPGLPTTDPDALFERFWRAEKGRERGRGGAGLGLAIVAAIVRAHGGEVVAENAPDGGARFVVTLR